MISIRLDVECPVKCGLCCIDCKYFVFETGCTIERRFRPMACNSWMCAEGTMRYNEECDK